MKKDSRGVERTSFVTRFLTTKNFSRAPRPAGGRRPFPFAEALMVLSLIVLAGALFFTSAENARARARDSVRLSDLRSVQAALEIYGSEHGGYPKSPRGGWAGACADYGGYAITGTEGYIPDLAPRYIDALPADPRPNGTAGCYIYRSDGEDYMLIAHGTVETIPPSDNPAPRPGHEKESDFAVYSNGAAGW